MEISMLLTLKIFLLSILSIVVLSEDKIDNSTVISRREILEQQARIAYQNTCYRLQELSNWMNAVFRIKGVWASATVNEISSRSKGPLTEADRRKMTGLPSRHTTTSSECSFSSVQTTAQTYAYLQSQIVTIKWLLGRNIFTSGKERLGEAKERMKVLETFNSTLNGVVSKLKQNTVNASATVDSEASKGRSITEKTQNGRLFPTFQNPKSILMNILDNKIMNNRVGDPTQPRSFFQNLGRNLDKLIFPVVPLKLNTINEQSVASEEVSVSETEHSMISAEHSDLKADHSVISSEHSEPKAEHPVYKSEQPLNNAQHSVLKISTSDPIMFSSIL